MTPPFGPSIAILNTISQRHIALVLVSPQKPLTLPSPHASIIGCVVDTATFPSQAFVIVESPGLRRVDLGMCIPVIDPDDLWAQTTAYGKLHT